MKEGLNGAAIRRIAANLQRADPTFPAAAFARRATKGIANLELKARVKHVIAALHWALPDDFPDAVRVLCAAKPHWDKGPPSNVSGFAAWPVIDYIGEYGLDYFDESLDALKQLTGLFTAEFAIRPFIAADPERALAIIETWMTDPDVQVRRLASEGTRPRLPWGMALKTLESDPRLTLPILEALKDDPEDYVQKSVGNHLNDHAKHHPKFVVKTCKRWKRGATPARTAIIKRALRNLVKLGDPGALAVLGYKSGADLKLTRFELRPKRLKFGNSLTISAEISSTSKKRQKLVVDYAIHHVKKNGERTPKVFKLKALELGPGEVFDIEKKHAIRAITTRVYYPGTHAVELLINGQSVGIRDFTLIAVPRS